MISLSHGDEPPPARGSGGHRPGSRVQGGPGPASAAAAAVSGLHCRSQVKARRAPEFKFQRLRRPRFNVTAPSRSSGAAAAGPRRLGDTLVPAIRAAKPLQRRAPRKLRRNQNLGRAQLRPGRRDHPGHNWHHDFNGSPAGIGGHGNHDRRQGLVTDGARAGGSHEPESPGFVYAIRSLIKSERSAIKT